MALRRRHVHPQGLAGQRETGERFALHLTVWEIAREGVGEPTLDAAVFRTKNGADYALESISGQSLDGKVVINLASRSLRGSGRLGLIRRVDPARIVASWWPVNVASQPALSDFESQFGFWHPADAKRHRRLTDRENPPDLQF
jgi:hypothetical protein